VCGWNVLEYLTDSPVELTERWSGAWFPARASVAAIVRLTETMAQASSIKGWKHIKGKWRQQNFVYAGLFKFKIEFLIF
jgi:hypothetical protein